MFGYIVKNIKERYTIEELSERYGVNLPSRKENEELIKCVDGTCKVDGHFYELNNCKKFFKKKGEKAHVNISNDKSALVFESRLGWFAKLIAMILAFINGIKEAIYNFFMNLLGKLKLPDIVLNILKVFVFILMLPFVILGHLFNAINMIRSAPGGILGMLFGFIIAIFGFILMMIFELIGIILTPIMNKIADSMIDKPFIKKMVIGTFVYNNKFPQGIVVGSSLVEDIAFEIRKNLLGKESLFVVISEGSKDVTIKDKILSFIFPDYFVNRQTVFATSTKNQAQFENIFNK